MGNRLGPILVLTGVAVAAALLYAIDPARSAFVPPCLFNRLTGLYCPGCGSMRALHAALHGDFAPAVGFNALAVFLLPFIVYSLGRMALPELLRQGPVQEASGAAECAGSCARRVTASAVLRRTYSSRVVLVAVLFFWVVRNLPWSPFVALAP